MKRRGFLGGIFGAAVVGPKAVAEAINVTPGPPAVKLIETGWVGMDGAPQGAAPGDRDYWMEEELKEQAYQTLLQKLMPDFYREDLKFEARQPGMMDIDIEAHRSWSMAAKVTAQRDRELKRHLEHRITRHKHRIAEHLLRKANGV